jgi:hypothetical protein
MAGFTTAAPAYLIRSQIWANQLKDVLQEELLAQRYVDWMTDFPDGDTFNIPSVGQAEVDDYVEDTPVKYRAMDTGNFQFTIDQYKSAGTYITKKMRQDSFYADRVEAMFVPAQHRAIMEKLETNILNLAMSQTASNTNAINGAAHRFVGSGTSEAITVTDFARALHSLKKANVPQSNLVAIVDPSVEYTLNTITNLVNFSNNPRWEGIVSSGIATGMKFIKNVFGFDVYTSQFLATANETIESKTTAAGKANMFFSADATVLPFVGAWRQMPEVDVEYNKDLQREEYVTTCRWGTKLYRPENLVVVLTDTDIVA